MFYYNQYVRAQSLDEAYELYQKKPNFVMGGMLWLKMKNKTLGTAIDLCDLGLDQIDEDENEFRIGAYATLRQIETHEALNAYTHGAIAESVRHIVGVQFRNVATVGGSIWGRFGFSDVMTIFRALGAKVQLHKAGIMDLDEFAALPRTTRDVLVSVIVPKNAKGIVYLSQRNQSTDFPVLTCAVANRSGRYVAVIGASPYMAEPVWDENGILDGITCAETAGNKALTENSENNEKIEKFAGYVAEHIRFGSNIRAGAEYREMICKVLTRRAVTQSLEICDDIM
ncbi:MAG: FAD binding domain-containing protein [Agathobacter sp.]|uniref:FAD binding domain-containing protein n=1 Tax=Agathobacter sp. TaxID=2021311 RepID=UPI002E762236|nr:FAD binding domain-containing protein [Agathobacter sp.]MEE1217640.1 FAD binding domain-containing protein [Agathobacter sp.]